MCHVAPRESGAFAAHLLFVHHLVDALPGHAEVFGEARLVPARKRVFTQQVADRYAELLKAFRVSSNNRHRSLRALERPGLITQNAVLLPMFLPFRPR